MKHFKEPYLDLSYNVDSYYNYRNTKEPYTDQIRNCDYKDETNIVKYIEDPYINTHYHMSYEEVPNLITNYNYVHENYSMNDEDPSYMERRHDILYNDNNILLDAYDYNQYLEPHNNNNNIYHSSHISDPYF